MHRRRSSGRRRRSRGSVQPGLGGITQPPRLTELGVHHVGIQLLAGAKPFEFVEGLPGAVHVLAVMLICLSLVTAASTKALVGFARAPQYLERGELTLHVPAHGLRKRDARRQLRFIRDAYTCCLNPGAFISSVLDAPRKQYDLAIRQNN